MRVKKVLMKTEWSVLAGVVENRQALKLATSAEKVFIYSALLILTATALMKVFSAGGAGRILDLHDPVLLLPERRVLILVALVELGVSGCLISASSALTKHSLLLWLSTAFLLYRICGALVAPGRPCPCLGTLGSNLFLSPTVLENLLRFVVAYLLLGSLSFLIARKCLATETQLPPSPIASQL